MFVFRTLFVLARFPEVQAEEGKYCKRNFDYDDCNAGIELARTRVSLIKRIQAERIYYGTKNDVETVRQFQFECEANSELQFSHDFDGFLVI